MIILTSTFSPAMLASVVAGDPVTVDIVPVSVLRAKQALSGTFMSGVGHPATRDMLGKVLGISLPQVDPNNRVKVAANAGDTLVVAQYVGRRLAEGEILDNPDPADFTFLIIRQK